MLEDAGFHNVIAEDRTDQVIHILFIFLKIAWTNVTISSEANMIIIVYVV
jgi:hypothetical protein